MKVILNQINRDEKIGDLLEAVLEACEFLEDSTETKERLHESPGQRKLVAQLVRQIIECYHFVDAYARKKLGSSQFCSIKVIIEFHQLLAFSRMLLRMLTPSSMTTCRS